MPIFHPAALLIVITAAIALAVCYTFLAIAGTPSAERPARAFQAALIVAIFILGGLALPV